MDSFFKKFKQVSAIIAVTIIVLLYIITLVLAVMNNSYTKRFFYASLFSSVFLPVMLYLMMWIAKVFRSYNPHLNQSPTDHNSDNSDLVKTDSTDNN